MPKDTEQREGREKREQPIPHTRRDNVAKKENAFSAYGLAKKIKKRQEMYDVE